MVAILESKKWAGQMSVAVSRIGRGGGLVGPALIEETKRRAVGHIDNRSVVPFLWEQCSAPIGDACSMAFQLRCAKCHHTIKNNRVVIATTLDVVGELLYTPSLPETQGVTTSSFVAGG